MSGVAGGEAVFDPLALLDAGLRDSSIGLLAALRLVDELSPDEAAAVVAETADPGRAAHLVKETDFLHGVAEGLFDDLNDGYLPVDLCGALAFSKLSDARRLGGRVALTTVRATLSAHSKITNGDIDNELFGAAQQAGAVEAGSGAAGRVILADKIMGRLAEYVCQMPSEEMDAAAGDRIAEYTQNDGADGAFEDSVWRSDAVAGAAPAELPEHLPLTEWGPTLQAALAEAVAIPDASAADNYKAGVHHALASLSVLWAIA
jgi:hypothetical protein